MPLEVLLKPAALARAAVRNLAQPAPVPDSMPEAGPLAFARLARPGAILLDEAPHTRLSAKLFREAAKEVAGIRFRDGVLREAALDGSVTPGDERVTAGHLINAILADLNDKRLQSRRHHVIELEVARYGRGALIAKPAHREALWPVRPDLKERLRGAFASLLQMPACCDACPAPR